MLDKLLQVFSSKTVIGLGMILSCACFMVLVGKFTPELSSFLQNVAYAFMGVRGVANFMELKGPAKGKK